MMLVALALAQLTSAQLVARVDAYYATVTTYHAPFKQTFVARAYNTTKVELGTLASSFTFTDPPVPFPGGFTLVGTPVQPTAQYTKVLFYVDSQTAHVRRITMIDAQRNTNSFEF